MENLKLEKKKDSFGVKCEVETGVVEIEGTSYPEDAGMFFEPVFNWIEEYITTIKKTLIFNFRINYLNTSTTKCILDIYDILESYYQSGGIVKINWYYKKHDKIVMETGEEFKEDLDIPFDLIEY